MPKLLAEYNLQMQAKLGALAATNIVFAGALPAAKFCAALQIERADGILLPQGNYQKIGFSADARRDMRALLGVAERDYVVLGVGFGDLRKGFDLFLQIARKMLAARGDLRFVWVGEVQPVLQAQLADEIAVLRQSGRFQLVGFDPAVAGYFSAADVFALTSREDPLPTVVIEAMACGVPVVAFEQAGAVPEMLLGARAGAVAAFADVDDFAAKLEGLLAHKTLRAGRARLMAKAQAQFAFAPYARDLLKVAAPVLKNVSICVMNFNYGRYLKARLDSVFAQTYPVAEILFLDDGSTDESLVQAHMRARDAGREMVVMANAQNAGSVFGQWQQALAAAMGEYVWIAEADDAAAPEFLSRVIEAMALVPDAVMGFADSRIIDAAGEEVSPSYQGHYRAAGAAGLGADGVWDGAAFARRFLAVENLIFNVSAVVWRRDALAASLARLGDEMRDWQLAGDWRLYLELLAGKAGSVVYVAEALNAHRRHGASVSQSLDEGLHMAEIARMHGIAASRLGLGEAVLAQQAAYLARLKKTFDVSKNKKSLRSNSRRGTRSVVASNLKV
jgi:hypothetical protein